VQVELYLYLPFVPIGHATGQPLTMICYILYKNNWYQKLTGFIDITHSPIYSGTSIYHFSRGWEKNYECRKTIHLGN
jgi:hypothetical protein